MDEKTPNMGKMTEKRRIWVQVAEKMLEICDSERETPKIFKHDWKNLERVEND